jgi:hypothetical protein
MDSPIKIEYQLNKQDYARSMRLFYARQLITRITLAIAAMLAVIGLSSILTSGFDSVFTVLAVLLLPYLVISTFLLRPYLMGQNAARHEHLISPIKMVIDDVNLTARHISGEHIIKWENVVELVEGKDYFLLRNRTNRNAYDLIPKRALSEQQLKVFRSLAAEKLPTLGKKP